MTVTVSNLTKRYGTTLALDSVDLSLQAGKVHALLGHNGAGKSTLIKCLGGGIRPTGGSITIGDEMFTGLDPHASIKNGVSVIYQHLSLIGSLTVAENLFLGQELTRNGLLSRGEQNEIAKSSLERVGSSVSPNARTGDLPIGQRQLIEIAKALQRHAKLLVLDEPSAALSPVEAGRLGELVIQLKTEGLAILYVTHLLNEVTRLADDTTVLRDGRVVWTSHMSGVTKGELVEAISGKDTGTMGAREHVPMDAGLPPVLSVTKLAGPGLGPVSLDVRPGEIVALYGLIGSGRTRLLETLFGARKGTSGTVRLDGRPITVNNPNNALKQGIALVPGDRHRQGLFGSLSALDNVTARDMSTVARAGVRSLRREHALFDDTARLMSLKPNNRSLPAAGFSGGNQQKLLIGRWVNPASQVRVLLLDDPTQGVDVGAREEIYSVIRDLARERSIAVIFATNEPEEVLELGHRCLVMERGRIRHELEVARTSEEQLLAHIHASPTGKESGA
ncbi:sugar ABC transporter ATP-binding protein [Specibacter sp. RAF43]|uniref:sugar ABC transporter ATP-binding protein n=1 Tax=Specibacter sp. RAF43 TaxID=3233057 RepID=UPI003F94D49A